jgi:protease IV
MKNNIPMQESVWSRLLKFFAIIFGLFILISLFAPSPEKECIGRIKINGEIVYDAPQPLIGESSAPTPEYIGGLLKEAQADNNVKAILIEINSPGGSAVASKEIYDEIRDAKKPTIAYFAEVAASGGYYVGAGTKYIVAHQSTITGSIGARTSILNYAGLFEKLGLNEEVIKSGNLKDIGSGSRNLTELERKLLQTQIDEQLQLFKKDVEEAREGKLNYALFNEALDARILSAKQALRIGLVDEIGGFKAVLKKANEMAGNKETDPEKQYPICDFGAKNGFSLFGGLDTEIGRNIAKGIVSGIKEQSTTKNQFQ